MSTTTTALNLEEFKPFIGRTQVATDVLHPGPANLLRLAFGREEPEYREGDALPPGVAGLLFPAARPRRRAAARRQPARHGGGAGPAAGAAHVCGERVRFHRPLRIGESLRRETELADSVDEERRHRHARLRHRSSAACSARTASRWRTSGARCSARK